MKLNAVVFHTPNLIKIREFYEGVLSLPTGTFVKNGETRPDYDDGYVNYHLGGGLLCFESEGDRLDLGTVILNAENFVELRERLKDSGIPATGNEYYFKVKDPDGRSVIIEPA